MRVLLVSDGQGRLRLVGVDEAFPIATFVNLLTETDGDCPEADDVTFEEYKSISTEEFGRGPTNPPVVVRQDNLLLHRFTLNTDNDFVKFPIPRNYHSGGLTVTLRWTNDGGTDDEGRTVRWQLDYKVTKAGDPVSGSHANSPRSIEDTYDSAAGWVEHETGSITIPEAEFSGQECIYIKISAVTPTGAALTCEPHLIGICLAYTAKWVG